MFWNLLLAHFTADFVLQTDWMVRNRHKLWVLSLHAATHLLMMVLMAGPSRTAIWPYLLLIALIHLSQDRYKIYLTNQRPDLTVTLFLIDQALHYALLGAVVWRLRQTLGSLPISEKPVLALIAIAYLFVTFVWFISERIFNLTNTEYLKDLNETKISRMMVRAGLVSLFVLVRTWILPAAASIVTNPYQPSKYRRQAILTDLSVSAIAIIFLVWALG
jgi:hypothetical protein